MKKYQSGYEAPVNFSLVNILLVFIATFVYNDQIYILSQNNVWKCLSYIPSPIGMMSDSSAINRGDMYFRGSWCLENNHDVLIPNLLALWHREIYKLKQQEVSKGTACNFFILSLPVQESVWKPRHSDTLY